MASLFEVYVLISNHRKWSQTSNQSVSIKFTMFIAVDPDGSRLYGPFLDHGVNVGEFSPLVRRTEFLHLL